MRSLPPDGALVRAIAGPIASWDDRTELAAATVDLLNRLQWLYRRVHFKGAPPKAPEPLRRPPRWRRGSMRARRRHATIEEMRATFGS